RSFGQSVLAEDGGRWPAFNDSAIAERVGHRGNGERELDGVGNHQHGLTRSSEVRNDRYDLAGHGRVERARGLVEQDYLRLHGESAGDRRPLLFASGELARPGVELVAEADPLEEPLGAGNGVLALQTEYVDRC